MQCLIFAGLEIIDKPDKTHSHRSLELDASFEIKNMVKKASESSGSLNPNTILEHLPKLTLQDIADINMVTTGQNENQAWHKMREGRITSSNFYQVYTKVSSLLRNPDCDVNTLLSYIMGYKHINPNIKSIKHGLETEPIAKKCYIEDYHKLGHTDISVSDCGLFVDIESPYLAASPDVLISCSCCGIGMAEIKCPLIPKCSTCNSFCKCILPNCLYIVDDNIHLKKNHSYFAQIQGQLAITKRKWCDLYVYTCNGSFTERLLFDAAYYQGILSHNKYFFLTYVIKEILYRDLQKSVDGKSILSNVPLNQNDSKPGSVFFCPICKKQIKELSSACYSYRDNSIECEGCSLWFHFCCVKLTKAKANKIETWKCAMCK